MNDNTTKRLKSFDESQEKYGNSYFGFFRNITTISVGLIGLLIGLKPTLIPNQNAKILFLLTIILIGLGILSSVVTQFYEVTLYKFEADARWKQLQEYIQNPNENSVQIESLKKSLIYKISELLTYFCLILSIISLILYVYFLEFY